MEEEQTILDEWEEIELPLPPELSLVTVDPKETALLILDIQNQNCNAERRPRCVAQIPRIQRLLSRARETHTLVIYSLTPSAEKKDIREEVTPKEGEPVVKAGVDKFYKTDLESILKEKKITKVILVGTSAHGAVLHTATGAAARGFDVIVPVDGMSADTAYAEQYTIWHIANAPGTKRCAQMTKIDWITIKE